MTTTRKVPQVVQDLQAARDVLEKGGWIQKLLFDAEGRHCAVGALGAVLDFKYNPRYWAAAKLLDDATGYNNPNSPFIGTVAVGYNNAPGRTKEEVLALFDKAIALGLGVPQLEEVASR